MTTRKRHTPEQVVRKLGQADRLLGEGKDVADVFRGRLRADVLPMAEIQFGGLKGDDAKRLKDRRRRTRASSGCWPKRSWKKAALKEIARGNF